MDQSLVAVTGQPPERPGLLARIFGATDAQVVRLKAEHALARLAIELDADLKRHRRKAHHYLEITALEDQAMKEITKAQQERNILDGIDEIFFDDPILSAVLKARVRAIFNHRNGHRRR